MGRKLLVDNAYEAWCTAIHYCNAIKEGKVTIQNKKLFISSLHNAVELFLKQMMLDNHDKKVIRKPTDIPDKDLLLWEQFDNTEINDFIRTYTQKCDGTLLSIQFRDLIKHYNNIVFAHDTINKEYVEYRTAKQRRKQIIATKYGRRKVIEKLNKLRNDETHFILRANDFLSEEEFQEFHNFMVDFYNMLSECSMLPYWGEPCGKYKKLQFSCPYLTNFTYLNAIKSSVNANKIIHAINTTCYNFVFDNSSYSCAEAVFEWGYTDLSFEEIYQYTEAFQHLGYIQQYDELITYEDENAQYEYSFYSINLS